MANIKLTKQQWQYVIVGAVILGAGGFGYVKFFWSPISKRIAEVEEKLAEVGAKIEKAKAQAARLPKLQEELALLNQQALEAEKRLPREKSVPDVLVAVSTLAQKHSVFLTSFAPGTQNAKPFYFELLYPVAVRGSFHNLGKFFAEMALQERIFNIQNVSFPGGSPDTGEMPATFVLVSYQYKG